MVAVFVVSGVFAGLAGVIVLSVAGAEVLAESAGASVEGVGAVPVILPVESAGAPVEGAVPETLLPEVSADVGALSAATVSLAKTTLVVCAKNKKTNNKIVGFLNKCDLRLWFSICFVKILIKLICLHYTTYSEKNNTDLITVY